MTMHDREGDRGITTLLRELAAEGAALARGEVRLMQLEIGTKARVIARGAGFVVMAVVFALLGASALLAGTVMLIGDQWLPADSYWLAALILLAITGAIAAWFGTRGAALVSPSRLAPHETVTSLKEDSEWLKQRLTSAAKSS